MIALAVTLVFALYILGPDAISRVLIGFTIPRRAVTLTRSEEVSRALLLAVFCFFVAYAWCRADGTWAREWQPGAVRVWFSGIYSEAYFQAHQGEWFGSLRQVARLNLSLLWRLYTTVFAVSVGLSLLTHFYGVVRDALPDWGWLRRTFASLVLPRVAQWHVLLSDVLLGDRNLYLVADILTKSDKLYQGELADKALAADGSLVSVTLASPRRFDRAAYLKAKDAGEQPNSEDFWKTIPTNMFLVLASDINTVNLRYVPRSRSVRPMKAGSPKLSELLAAIADQVETARKQAEGSAEHSEGS